MSVEEYIAENRPFYHITLEDNVASILAEGLNVGYTQSYHGICVIRECQDIEILIHEIIDCELHTCNVPDDSLFCVIKLTPEKHGITEDDVAPDPIQEVTAPLYNYICKDRIEVDDSDIIMRNIKFGLYRGEEIEVQALTDYQRYV